jgi:hypothetical protein
MTRLAIAAVSGVLVAVSLPCAAGQACKNVAVEASVEIAQGELTLADLLTRNSCPQWREAAAQVSLGAAPRAGSARVLDGRRVRLLLEGLGDHLDQKVEEAGSMQIPERIVVQRAGAVKSCSAIAGFLAGATSAQMAGAPSRWQEKVDCAAARGIPETAALELAKATWNAALQRWEFALRCARPEDCIPFLVWVQQEKTSPAKVDDARSGGARGLAFRFEPSARTLAKAGENAAERLVKRGQTAMLTWEQAGIRVVVPVTCLEAGGLGQFVRVRFKSTARTLLAEVVGAGTLRASL